MLDEREAHLYAECVRRGGTLVAARVEGNEVLKARDILSDYRPVDLIAREAVYLQVAGVRSMKPRRSTQQNAAQVLRLAVRNGRDDMEKRLDVPWKLEDASLSQLVRDHETGHREAHIQRHL